MLNLQSRLFSTQNWQNTYFSTFMHFITHVNFHRHPERRWWSDDFLGLVHSFLLLQTNHTIPSYHNIPSFHAIPSYNTILSYDTTHNTLHYLLSAPDPTNACPTLPQPLLQQPIGWSRLSEPLYFFFTDSTTYLKIIFSFSGTEQCVMKACQLLSIKPEMTPTTIWPPCVSDLVQRGSSNLYSWLKRHFCWRKKNTFREFLKLFLGASNLLGYLKFFLGASSFFGVLQFFGGTSNFVEVQKYFFYLSSQIKFIHSVM